MNKLLKFIPWVLVIVISLAFFVVWSQMNARLDQQNAELADLKAKYEQVVAEANQKIQDANHRLEAVAQEADEKIRLAQLPEVEVTLGFRKALFSSGNVAVIKNTSGESIALTAVASRPGSDYKKAFEITVDSGQTREIGEQEGWAFVKGDAISLSQAEHKSLTFVSP
jgi:hypothetical protein